MAKLKKGDLVIETSLPSEIVNLKAQGFRLVEGGVVTTSGSGAQVYEGANPATETVAAPKPGTPRK